MEGRLVRICHTSDASATRICGAIFLGVLPTVPHRSAWQRPPRFRLGKAEYHEPDIVAAQTAQGRDHLFVDRSAKET